MMVYVCLWLDTSAANRYYDGSRRNPELGAPPVDVEGIRAATCPPHQLTASLGREAVCELFRIEGADYDEACENAAANIIGFPRLYGWMIQYLDKDLRRRVDRLREAR